MGVRRLCIGLSVWGCLVASMWGCAGNSDEAMSRDEAARKEWDAEADALASKEFDLNQDGKTDVWKYYIPKAEPGNPTPEWKVARKEMDLNYDGKVDVWILLDENGQVVTEKYDLDFDGKVDRTDHMKSGVITVNGMQAAYDRVQELDFQFDESPDALKYYLKDQLVWKESDSNGDGRSDYWERYVDGVLTHYGQDIDGDGRIDEWLTPLPSRKRDVAPEPAPAGEQEDELPEPDDEGLPAPDAEVEGGLDEAGAAARQQKDEAERATEGQGEQSEP